MRLGETLSLCASRSPIGGNGTGRGIQPDLVLIYPLPASRIHFVHAQDFPTRASRTLSLEPLATPAGGAQALSRLSLPRAFQLPATPASGTATCADGELPPAYKEGPLLDGAGEGDGGGVWGGGELGERGWSASKTSVENTTHRQRHTNNRPADNQASGGVRIFGVHCRRRWVTSEWLIFSRHLSPAPAALRELSVQATITALELFVGQPGVQVHPPLPCGERRCGTIKS